MNENWHGLIRILEIQCVKDGDVLWKEENLYNIFHSEGEEFMLSAVFTGGVTNTFIPEYYYFGLDNRTTLDATDTMTSLTQEPSTNGYTRQMIASTGQFTISQVGGIYVAESPIVSFSASGGAWGPVRNLFLTTQTDVTGYLISSVPLSQQVTVEDGASINVRMALGLKDCP